MDPGTPRVKFNRPNDSPLPFEARGLDPADASLPIEIMLFAREGALSSLEIVYYGDTPPSEFPDPAGLEVQKLR